MECGKKVKALADVKQITMYLSDNFQKGEKNEKKENENVAETRVVKEINVFF